jgi:hypothetical protein
LFFFYGTGGNGKGVFLNTITAILADHAAVAPMETFIVTQGERHPTDLAGLRGAARYGTGNQAGAALGREQDQAQRTLRAAARCLRQSVLIGPVWSKVSSSGMMLL